MAKKNSTLTLSFEQLYSKLEATIETLEGGNLSLDETLELYEQGMELAKQCSAMLDNAELRIQELAPVRDASDEKEALEWLDTGDDE